MKTIKELEPKEQLEVFGTNFVFTHELRNSAIDDIKELRKKIGKLNEIKNQENEGIWIQKCILTAKIEYIKRKFDIKEEDI